MRHTHNDMAKAPLLCASNSHPKRVPTVKLRWGYSHRETRSKQKIENQRPYMYVRTRNIATTTNKIQTTNDTPNTKTETANYYYYYSKQKRMLSRRSKGKWYDMKSHYRTNEPTNENPITVFIPLAHSKTVIVPSFFVNCALTLRVAQCVHAFEWHFVCSECEGSANPTSLHNGSTPKPLRSMRDTMPLYVWSASRSCSFVSKLMYPHSPI